MPKLDDKMQMISTSIVLQAEQERKSVIDKANLLRDKEITAFREELVETLSDQLQLHARAVRRKAVREKALAETACRRELLTRRGEFTGMVFGAVSARLREYAGTAAYRTALLDSLRGLAGRWDHAASVVQLREADMALEPDIRAALPGCRVEAARAIKLGGYRLVNSAAGILLDETLDARLEEQRPWFLQTCGLRVTEEDGQSGA